MAPQPLTQRHQQIAASYGWQGICILTAGCPFGQVSSIKQGQASATGYRVGDGEYWMNTTTKGVEITHGPRAEVIDRLTWRAWVAHKDTLSAATRHHVERVHARMHSTFPEPDVLPWQREGGYDPVLVAWRRERARRLDWMTEQVRRLAYPAAFIPAECSEPTDLLELLALQEAAA